MDSIDREPPDIPPDSSPGNTAPDPISRNILLYSSEHKFNWYKLLIQAKPSDNVDTSRKPYVRVLAVSKGTFTLGQPNLATGNSDLRRIACCWLPVARGL
ncbi:hypothetical protein M8J77_007945 [Diaphorina citri]|nr:hypothetical protein M8J77_007945 [Diaphorina citri]